MKSGRFIKIIGLALAIAVSCIGCASNPEFVEGTDIPVNKAGDFDFERKEARITNYKGKSAVVGIPAQIRGMTVRFIDNNAFYNKGLTSVGIPETVVRIESALLSGGVVNQTSGALAKNQLTEVVIPGSVENIGRRAFWKNKLTRVVLSSGKLKTIGDYAFAENQLTGIVIPGSVKTIGSYAFAENQLTEIVVPEGVTGIGVNAFANNKLTQITIRASVVELGDNIAAGNPLAAPFSVPNYAKTIIFADDFEGQISGQGDSRTITITKYSGGKSNYSAGGRYGVIAAKVVVPAAAYGIPVTKIGANAFGLNWESETSINELVLPAGITSIDNTAFINCNIRKVSPANDAVAAVWKDFWDVYEVARAKASAEEFEREMERLRDIGRVAERLRERYER
jgi:hypothetical protein